MSWLKNISSKVRESGEALKQSQALNSLSEKVASVKRRASTNAASKSNKSAADLGSELEKGASNVRKAHGLAEMHKAWMQQISVSGTKEAQSYHMEDSERTLGFKEVLLRSRALEVTIETIASDASLRASYSELPAVDDKTSPVACLHVLLAKTLSVPANLWSEVVRLAMCSDGLTSEEHIAWLISAISAMKVDWEEEMLTAERKELALRAEYLRQDLKQLESKSDDSDATYQRRVAASSELLQTYQAVRSNLEEAQAHRSQTRAAKEKGLAHIIEQVEAHMVSLQSSAETSAERQKNMEGELKQSQEGIVLQLDNMTDARNAIDKELEDLEARKRELKMELDEVAKKLDETRTRQRKYMEDSDKQRNDLETLKTTVKGKIETEVSVIKEAERERNVIERTQQLLRDTDGVVQRTLGGQLEELRKKQSQFNEHFQQLLKEHMSHVEVQLRHLRTQAESSSEETQQRAEAFDAATAAQQEFDKFSSEYGDCLKGTELEAKVKELTAEHAAIQKLLAPAPEEVVSAPTDAAASAEDSTAAPSAEESAPTDAAASAEDSTAAPSAEESASTDAAASAEDSTAAPSAEELSDPLPGQEGIPKSEVEEKMRALV